MSKNYKKYNGTFFSYIFGNRPQIDKTAQFKAEVLKSVLFIFISALFYSLIIYLFSLVAMVFNVSSDITGYLLNSSNTNGMVITTTLMSISYYLTYYFTFRQTYEIIKQYEPSSTDFVEVKSKVFIPCIIGYGFAMLGNVVSAWVCFLVDYISNFFSGEVRASIISSITGGNLNYTPFETSFVNMCMLFVFTVIIPPFVEELIFRKVIYGHLTVFNEKVAVLLSTVLFAVFHGNIQQMSFALFAGLGFIIVRKYTGKLRYSILTHICVNISAFVVQFLTIKIKSFATFSNIFILVFSIIAVVLFVFNNGFANNLFKNIKVVRNKEEIL